MYNGQVVYVVVKHTPRLVSVVEGFYLATSESGNGTMAYVDDSGLTSFAKGVDVFETKDAANARKVEVEGGR